MPTNKNNKQSELKESLANLLSTLEEEKKSHEELVEFVGGVLPFAYFDLDPLYKVIKVLQPILNESLDSVQLLKKLIDIEPLFLKSSVLVNYPLPNFRSFFDPKILTHEKIDRQLAILEMKALDLDCRGHKLAAAEVKNLVLRLGNLNHAYFSEEKIDPNYYKEKALEIIDKSRPVLEQHRGYKKMLGNLILLISTVGTAFLIHKACTGHFLFFKQTDSAKQINALSETINTYPIQQS